MAFITILTLPTNDNCRYCKWNIQSTTADGKLKFYKEVANQNEQNLFTIYINQLHSNSALIKLLQAKAIIC